VDGRLQIPVHSLRHKLIMTQLPLIFAIDDRQEKLDIVSEALTSLKKSGEMLGTGLQQIKISTPDEYVRARSNLSTVTGGGIILLDLAFRFNERQALWPEIGEALRQLSVRAGLSFVEADKGKPDELILQTPEGEIFIRGLSLDGLAVIEIILQNAGLSPCLIIPCSSQGELNDLHLFLEVFNKVAQEANRKVMLVRDPAGRSFTSLPGARGLLRDLESWWITSFPSFSSEARIDSTVREWLRYFRSLDRVIVMNPPEGFCGHNHIEGQENVRAYAKILERGLGCDSSLGALEQPQGLKAVFKVDASVLDTGWPGAAFGVWPPRDHSFEGSAKPMDRGMWSSIMEAISGLELTMKDRRAKLPITPGLPFLLALRSVFEALRREELLDTSSTIIISSGEGIGTRLTIPLKQERDVEFGLARTWIKKVEEGQGTLNRGICGHLWNLIKAQVPISSDGLSNSDGDDRLKERRLLELFEGPRRPVAGLHFAPHFIHIYWN
jgi:hypothetical protein